MAPALRGDRPCSIATAPALREQSTCVSARWMRISMHLQRCLPARATRGRRYKVSCNCSLNSAVGHDFQAAIDRGRARAGGKPRFDERFQRLIVDLLWLEVADM